MEMNLTASLPSSTVVTVVSQELEAEPGVTPEPHQVVALVKHRSDSREFLIKDNDLGENLIGE